MGEVDVTGLTATEIALLDRIDAHADDLVQLTLSLSALDDRAGHEQPVAEAVQSWWTGHDVPAELIPLSRTSANVVATLPVGRSGQPALTLNAHLDTEGGIPNGNGERRHRLRGAWRDGNVLVGKGLVNDKIHVAAQMVAGLALLESAVPLVRSVMVAGVAQETGALVPRHPPGQGPNPLAPPQVGEGSGTKALLAAGLSSDCALIGEPNGFAVGGAQAGVFRIRVDVIGQMPYTPFMRRPARGLVSPNPYEQAGVLVVALTEWARRYERREQMDFWGGTVVPTAQVHGIRSWGQPFTEQRESCHVYFDVRPPPGADLDALHEEIEQLVARLDIETEMTVYDRHPGYVLDEAAAIVGVVRRAHRTVHRREPPTPTAPQVSMWQDTNAYLAVGVPAVSYGIPTVAEEYTIERRRAVRISDAVALTKVYALVALDCCGVSRA